MCIKRNIIKILLVNFFIYFFLLLIAKVFVAVDINIPILSHKYYEINEFDIKKNIDDDEKDYFINKFENINSNNEHVLISNEIHIYIKKDKKDKRAWGTFTIYGEYDSLSELNSYLNKINNSSVQMKENVVQYDVQNNNFSSCYLFIDKKPKFIISCTTILPYKPNESNEIRAEKKAQQYFLIKDEKIKKKNALVNITVRVIILTIIIIGNLLLKIVYKKIF